MSQLKEAFSDYMNKKGFMNARLTGIFGALIIVIILGALANDFFSINQSLADATGVPGWVVTVVPIIVGAGFVFIIWRVFSR